MKTFKFWMAFIVVLALTACGGGSGGESKYSLSLDVSSVSFKKMNDDSTELTKEVRVIYKGDGVIAGIAPNLSHPYWMDVALVSSSATSARFLITIPGGRTFDPATYTTTVRFITGNKSGTDVVYVDLPVSLFVDEPFNALVEEPLEFWLVGDNTQQLMPQNGIGVSILGGETEWHISADKSWLQFDKTSGIGAADVAVIISPDQAGMGVNYAKVTVQNTRTGETKLFDASFERKEADLGVTVVGAAPFIFNFDIEDILIDLSGNKMYITDDINYRLYIINLETGLTEKYFSFDMMPASMALSPDRKKLYVSLLTQENSPYYWIEDQQARVAIVDTEQEKVANEFRLNVAPGDLVVTSNNQLIVGGGSSQHVYFYFYNAISGELTKKSQLSFSPITHMELLPSEESFYFAVSWRAPPPVTRFDLSVISSWYIDPVPAPHGDWTSPNDFWIDTTGTYGVTTEGDVFKTQDSSYVTRITDAYIYLKAAAFDSVNNRLVIVSTANKVVEYDTATWTERKILAENFSDLERLLFFNDKIQVLRKGDTGYYIEPLNL